MDRHPHVTSCPHHNHHNHHNHNNHNNHNSAQQQHQQQHHQPHQQPTTNQQPTANNQQPTTNNQQPTTNNQEPTTNKGSDRFALLCVVNTVVRTLTVGLLMAERDGGSARRRRERQLRSFLRHERMTVRMELAAALHHSAYKGAGPRRTTLHGARRRSTPGRKRCSSSCLRRTPQGGGQRLCLRWLARRHGFCSAPWSRLSSPSFLCR